MIVGEKDSRIGLLKSSSIPSYSDLFGIVEDIKLTIPLMCILTSLSISIS